jgi:hypothetical protein
MANLVITDRYPQPNASSVYINDVVWAQFSEPIASGTANYYNFSVTERDTYDTVTGTVVVRGVSGQIDNAIAMFIPTDGFSRNTRYAALVTAGITNQAGDKALDGDEVWHFTTGNTASSGTIGADVYNLDPSGFTAPASSGVIADTGASGIPLAVIATSPDDYGTNIALDTQHVAIEFNYVIPSGIDLYDKIAVSSKDIF